MAEPRTVLHLIDTGGPGGAETIFLNVISGLDPRHWRSIAVVPIQDWLWDALQARGIEPVLLPTRGSFDLRYLLGVRRLIQQHGVDLIQTHLFTSAVYASLAVFAERRPVVSTFHGRNDVLPAESYRRAKFRIVRRRWNRSVFVSHNLRDWYVERGSIDVRRAHVIHNGIDCQQYRPGHAAAVRASLGAQPGDLLIGAVGNLRVPKDYPTFLRAAAILARRSPRYRFVIVGAADQPIRGELERLRAALGLEERLLIAGFRDDTEWVMNALDVYVLSSSSEGFSLTTVQAMACAVPVVATRCGGPEEIVIEGSTGLLVSPGDSEAMAAAIQRLGDDPALRTAFGQAGRGRAVESFSIDSMIRGYSSLYAECLPAVPLELTGSSAETRTGSQASASTTSR